MLTDIMTPTPQEPQPDHPFEHQLQEVEMLVNEMKRLLVKSESALEHEGIRNEMETLERWMESYRRGLSAASKLSTTGVELLKTIKDKLKLAVEEKQRLEDEGGSTADKKQAAEFEELVKASRRLEELIPTIEQVFCGVPHETAQPAAQRQTA